MARVAKIEAELQLATGQFKRDVNDSKADMTSLGAAIRERKNDFLMVESAAKAQASATRTAAQEAKRNATEQAQAAREARAQAQEAAKAAKDLAVAAKNAAPEMKKALEEQADAAKKYATELRTVANAQSEVSRQARADAQEKSRISREAQQIAAQAKRSAKEQADAAKEHADAQEKAARQAAESSKKTAQAIDDVASRAALAAAAIIAVFGAAVIQYAKVDQALANLRSVTDASQRDLNQVKDAAEKLGPAYAVMSDKAVDAVTEFVKAGVDMKRLAGGELKDALALMVAGELDVGDAANYASGALNTYKKENLSLKTVADTAAGAANASATSVKEMTFANQALGPVAAQVGAAFNDVNAVLALFANNGLRGSDAGTSLKTTILALIKPTEDQQKVMDELGLSFFNNEGKLKSFAEISEMLHTKLARFKEKDRGEILSTLGGSDGVRALSILANEGAAGLQEMDRAMKQVTADQTAKIKIDSLTGSLKEMQAEAGVAGEKLGESMAPAAGLITSVITELLKKYNELDAGSRAVVNGTAAMGAGFFATIATVLLLVTAFQKVKIAAAEANIAIGALSKNPLVLAVAAAIGAVTWLGTKMSDAAEMARKFDQAQTDLNKTLEQTRTTKDENKFKEAGDEAKALEDLAKQYEDLNKKRADLSVGGWMNGHQKEISEVDDQLEKLNKTMTEHGVTSDNVRQKASELRAAMSSNIPMMQQMVSEEIADAAAKQQQIAHLEQLRDRYNQLSSATSLNSSETAELRAVTEQLKQTMPQLVVVEDERGRAIITNNEALNERIGVEKDAAEASRKAAEQTIRDQMAVAQAHIESAQAVIAAYDAITSARATFLADAASGVDPTLSDEKHGMRLMAMADQAAKNKSDAQKILPILQASLSKSKDDLARITGDAYKQIGTKSGGGGGTDEFDMPKDEKKGKTAEELAREADAARKDAYDKELAYARQRRDQGVVDEEGYISLLKGIRSEYSDWLARNQTELYSISNEIEHESFSYSEAWISKKKQAMQDAGASSLSVAQMEMEGWTRVLSRTSLLAADRARAQQEYDRAAKDYRSASFTESEKWIGENEKKMTRSGATELEIAKSTYNAWSRVNAKRAEYNPEDQLKATEQLTEAQTKLTDAIATNLKKAREYDRDQDLAEIERRSKAAEDAIQSKIDALDKEAQAQKYLLDLENERQKLADLQEQRNKVAGEKRFAKIEVGADGKLVETLVADPVRLAELDKQIKEQQTRIADMQRDEEQRKKREQLEQELRDTRDSNAKLKASHDAYWTKLLSDEQINADTRTAIQKNGLDKTLADVKTYLGLMQAEYDAAQAKIMAAGGIFFAGSGTVTPSPVYGPPAPPGYKSTVDDFKSQMAANSEGYKNAKSQVERDYYHDQNVKIGTARGGKYDDRTGTWTFHTGVDSVPGPVGADVQGVTLQAGERVFSVSQNRTFEAFMTALMTRQTATDRLMQAISTARSQSQMATAPGRMVGNLQINVPISLVQQMEMDIDQVSGNVERVVNKKLTEFMQGVHNV